MPRKTQHVLTVAEVAAELGISSRSVRTTMNRRGYREVRGYLRRDVDAVKRDRLGSADDEEMT